MKIRLLAARTFAMMAAPLLAGACAAVPAQAPQPASSAPALYPDGMVSAADPRAADAGAAMLRQGGSATDAAIATMLALTVVEPQSSGIGGGGFYVTADAAGHVSTIDGRETAPASATQDWFVKDGKVLTFAEAVPGGTSIGVPGNLALAARAHAAHGKLAWKALFAPAIALAKNGFEVTPRLYGMLKTSSNTAAFTPAGKALFYGADGNPRPVGTRIVNTALAATLEKLASGGRPAFYAGANAAAVAAAARSAPINPSSMTQADIASYVAKPRDAVCGTYRGYRICGMGPPSSGATTVLATLGALERFDIGKLGPDSPVAWHLIAESMRLAYADRAKYLADADFESVPVAGLVDKGYLASRSALIDPARTIPAVDAGTPPGAKTAYAPAPAQVENGTSHFVTVDRAGNVVTYTSTIESPFGSGMMAGGYYLNNELTDFDMAPTVGGVPVANRPGPGKRPRSSMAPTLVYGPDGALRLAVGAAGGATIPAQVLRAIIGVIDWNLSAQAAIDLPVLFAPTGDTVFVEKGSRLEALIPALTQLGHKVMPRELPLKANAIEVVGGRLVGAADPRSEGRAVAE
ncbi:gamma-glutamyltransferase [Parablastomonas sp. CN1-191]|uniref:gamma-glutamyltransferase n=1 Tax=Parablastomonas sp. CN1-191 TaxID=3400908 RepID=UPI003BF7E07F